MFHHRMAGKASPLIRWDFLAAAAVVAVAVSVWFQLVQDIVPAPYLVKVSAEASFVTSDW